MNYSELDSRETRTHQPIHCYRQKDFFFDADKVDLKVSDTNLGLSY